MINAMLYAINIMFAHRQITRPYASCIRVRLI